MKDDVFARRTGAIIDPGPIRAVIPGPIRSVDPALIRAIDPAFVTGIISHSAVAVGVWFADRDALVAAIRHPAVVNRDDAVIIPLDLIGNAVAVSINRVHREIVASDDPEECAVIDLNIGSGGVLFSHHRAVINRRADVILRHPHRHRAANHTTLVPGCRSGQQGRGHRRLPVAVVGGGRHIRGQEIALAFADKESRGLVVQKHGPRHGLFQDPAGQAIQHQIQLFIATDGLDLDLGQAALDLDPGKALRRQALHHNIGADRRRKRRAHQGKGRTHHQLPNHSHSPSIGTGHWRGLAR